MRTLAVDENNDIYIALDNLAVVNDLSAASQCCEHSAKSQLNEMVLAWDQGVANFQTIWADSRNILQYEAFLRRAILSVQNVTGITRLDISIVDNTVRYTAEITTTYGSASIAGDSNGTL